MQFLSSRPTTWWTGRRAERARVAPPWRTRRTARPLRLDSSTHYAVLGVRRDAGRGEIVRAYRLCAKRLHPDVSPDPGALEQFKRAKAAYEALRDPVRRIRYDAMLAALDAPGPGVPAVVRPALFTQRVEDGLIGGFVSLAGIGMLYVLALLVAH